MIGHRIQPRLQVVVRAAGKPDYHPRPVTLRYKPRGKEIITWWEFCAVGWHAVRAAALSAGLCQVNLIRPTTPTAHGCAAAWREAPPLHDPRLPSFQRDEDTALRLIRVIGTPTAAQIAHQCYKPVANPKPRGVEGAGHKLARTALAPCVTEDVAREILRMFEGMGDCADKHRHLRFWTAAVQYAAGARARDGGNA